MEIKVTGKQGGKREERMIEGKREKLGGKRVGEENDEEERRGEVNLKKMN